MPSIFALTANLALNSQAYETGIRAAANVTDAFVDTVQEAISSSIKLGANLEMSENSLKVFTGSMRRAKAELSEIDKMARSTVGLRLQTAESGVVRLRALGFEATRARDLIKELSEEQILSSTTDENLQRVIFNFQQIASGGQRISQEIRELLTAMPSLQRVFMDAFGSLDPKKIQAVLDADPNKFFDKLIDSMKRGESAQGGLNDAFDKFKDEFIRAGRGFSSGFLPELTRTLRELTDDLARNKDAIIKWGEAVGDVLTFLSNATNSEFFTMYERLQDLGNRTQLDFLTRGFSNGNNLEGFARQLRGIADNLGLMEKGKNYLTGETSAMRAAKQGKAALDELTDARNEAAAEAANALRALEQEQQRALTRELASVEGYYENRLDIIQNAFQIEEARLTSHLDLTLQDELRTIKRVSSAKSSYIREQITEQSAYFAKLLKLNAGSNEEVSRIILERNKTLRGLNSELIINELETQKLIAQKEREIEERRRAAAERSRQITVDELRENLNSYTSFYDRLGSLTVSGYQAVRSETERIYSQITQFTSEQFGIQLQNEKLSAEERANLIREAGNEQVRISREVSGKILEIEEKQHAQSVEMFRAASERISGQMRGRANLFSSVLGSFFQNNINFGEGVKPTALMSAFGLEPAKIMLEQIQDVISGSLPIYEAQRSVLDKVHKMQQVGLEREIDLNRDLIELEKIRLRGLVNTEVIRLEGQYQQLLQKRANLPEDSTADRDAIQADADAIQKKINELKGITDSQLESQSPAIMRYKGAIEDTTEAIKQLKLTQAAEGQNLFAQSTEGLKQFYEAIRSGQKDAIIAQIAERDLWQQKSNLALEIKMTQAQIANYNQIEPLAIEKAYLEEILQLRQLETQRIIEANRSLMDRVRMMSAELPEQSALLKDSFISSLDAISSSFAAAATQWDGTFKGFLQSLVSNFAQAMQSIIAELIRVAVYKFILQMIGGIAGVGGATTTGAVTKGLKGLGGFASGGFTGYGNPSSVAGLVHANEYVFDKKAVDFWGLGNLKRMQNMQMPQGANPMMPTMPTIGGNTSTTNDNRQFNLTINAPTPTGGQTNNLQGGQVTIAQQGRAMLAQLREIERRG